MSFTVGTINACGLRRKRHLLKALLTEHNISILSVTETKLKFDLKMSNYNTYQRNSTLGTIRGAALLIHDSLHSTQFKLPDQFSNLECVASKVTINNIIVTIISLYHPPGETFPDNLFEFVSLNPHTILLGDFNARNIQFGDNSTNRNGQILSECLIENNLWRCPNTNPTFFSHTGMSIIDHIIITPDLIQYFEEPCFIGQTITSDHLPLLVHSNIAQPPKLPPTIITLKDFKNTDWEQFRAMIIQTFSPPQIFRNTHEIDQIIEQYSTSVSETYNACTPDRTINLNRAPLPPFIVNLIKNKRRLYRLFLRNRDAAIKTEYNRLSAIIRREINRFKEEKWADITSKLDFRNGKEYWRQFHLLSGNKKKKTIHLKSPENDNIISEPQEIANIFKQHLSNIFITPQNPRFDANHFVTVERNIANFRGINSVIELNGDNIFDTRIDAETVAEAVHSGKNTAPGRDGLSRAVIRQLPQECFEFLSNIFNRCLELCYFPNVWKEATTILIPKPSGDPTNPDNYRPISLLNVIGKVFEKILQGRLRDFAESNDILPRFQHGFRTFHSTQDPLLQLHSELTVAINSGECVLATFLDIHKAFDQVWHAGLVQKLLNIRLPFHFVKLINSFLTERIIRVKISNSYSEPFSPLAGIPQGSILSPLLYIIYTYDIPNPVNLNTHISLFADDTALWTTGRTTAVCSRELQRQLDAFSTWARKWRITPNPSKTQSILFHNYKQSKSPKFKKRKFN
ncbi:hypothetical protein WA026_010217 [Henosepilachna vigintioctopunctata]|uniref:Reverse transcriptase domain-containing protein n=1 Tax=Henosepilachna vigintioctopunctata TaxID=420089 RepID=A0AAW1U9A9_9CUCU